MAFAPATGIYNDCAAREDSFCRARPDHAGTTITMRTRQHTAVGDVAKVVGIGVPGEPFEDVVQAGPDGHGDEVGAWEIPPERPEFSVVSALFADVLESERSERQQGCTSVTLPSTLGDGR
ncbi:MAG: hypothetical protein WA317_04255 [Mycobacterium sp.]|uniref:hypothetical protein n=1 Tax=Mycobacterium sp. TaxID=1785 RepID=UPI003CC604BC